MYMMTENKPMENGSIMPSLRSSLKQNVLMSIKKIFITPLPFYWANKSNKDSHITNSSH